MDCQTLDEHKQDPYDGFSLVWAERYCAHDFHFLVCGTLQSQSSADKD